LGFGGGRHRSTCCRQAGHRPRPTPSVPTGLRSVSLRAHACVQALADSQAETQKAEHGALRERTNFNQTATREVRTHAMCLGDRQGLNPGPFNHRLCALPTALPERARDDFRMCARSQSLPAKRRAWEIADTCARTTIGCCGWRAGAMAARQLFNFTVAAVPAHTPRAASLLSRLSSGLAKARIVRIANCTNREARIHGDSGRGIANRANCDAESRSAASRFSFPQIGFCITSESLGHLNPIPG
jgi:hypothetical protein